MFLYNGRNYRTLVWMKDMWKNMGGMAIVILCIGWEYPDSRCDASRLIKQGKEFCRSKLNHYQCPLMMCLYAMSY